MLPSSYPGILAYWNSTPHRTISNELFFITTLHGLCRRHSLSIVEKPCLQRHCVATEVSRFFLAYVFTESLSSNERLFWLYYSGFRASYQNNFKFLWIPFKLLCHISLRGANFTYHSSPQKCLRMFTSFYPHVFINVVTGLRTARYAFITFSLWLAENEDGSFTNGSIYILKPCIYFVRCRILDL
jgi:hypothetical protein